MTNMRFTPRKGGIKGAGAACGLRVGSHPEGCDCLSLRLSWSGDRYRVNWSHIAPLTSREERREWAALLRKRIGRTTFWIPLMDTEAEQNLAVHAVDLDVLDASGRSLAKKSNRQGFVIAQVGSHVARPSTDDLAVADTVEVAPNRMHTVGAMARRAAIDQSFSFWSREMALRSPRVGVVPIAIANTVLALLPSVSTDATPTHRLFVLEMLHATYGCYLYGSRLRHFLYYTPPVGHRLHPDMLTHWCGLIRDEFEIGIENEIDVKVIQSWSLDDRPQGVDERYIWNPWQSEQLNWESDTVRSNLLDNLELAPVAFGLALQGR